jgi:hypothetical protein
MRTQLAFASAVLGCVLAACGGDDGGSSGVDAAPPPVDAPQGPQAAQGLGKTCTSPADCPTSAPLCAKATQTGPGFCTLSCGTTAVPPQGMDPTPPADGTAMCMAAQPAPPSGTPLCAITGSPANDMIPWACGIACGSFMGQDLGECPQGLTCNANLCQL